MLHIICDDCSTLWSCVSCVDWLNKLNLTWVIITIVFHSKLNSSISSSIITYNSKPSYVLFSWWPYLNYCESWWIVIMLIVIILSCNAVLVRWRLSCTKEEVKINDRCWKWSFSYAVTKLCACSCSWKVSSLSSEKTVHDHFCGRVIHISEVEMSHHYLILCCTVTMSRLCETCSVRM